MRKTSFFYSAKFVLLILLAWMVLLDEAVRLNMSQKSALTAKEEARAAVADVNEEMPEKEISERKMPE
ncbi:MAG: hypothetical protein Q4C77_02275, partial [Eubacteriales bacterium]|nr:hypothetical protein [Eubacteriales bacterium]